MKIGQTVFSLVGALTAAAALCVPAGIAGAQIIQSQTVASGLSQPLGVANIAGDTSRLFIVEQVGRIRVLDLTTPTPTLLATPFLNIGPAAISGLGLTTANGEQGLLGLAFDPNYASNGRFYINYTNNSGNTVIARYTANAPFATSNTANTGSALIFQLSNSPAGYTVAQPYSNHNGGQLQFGPDGMLYCTLGDGGSANDPEERAQNTGLLLGKILRLDVNDLSAADGDGLYIPDNNPFRGAGNPLDEIWALGMRNPWRLSFDRLTGDMWIGDVGQDAHEEIDFQPAVQLTTPGNGNSVILNAASIAGRNYGWDNREGLFAAPLTAPDPDPDYGTCTQSCTFTDPIMDVPQSGTPACSITGGFVYRGSAIPALQGQFFFSDYCGGFIRSFAYNAPTPVAYPGGTTDWTGQLSVPTGDITGIVSFGEDAAGELYIVSINQGTVTKIVPYAPNCGIPGTQTTLFQDSFQSDLGWTVTDLPSGTGTFDGSWQRGTPVASSNYANDPVSDSDNSGLCWVTENSDPGTGSTSDVDNGSTVLTSPVIDMTGAGNITICYAYYINLTEVGGANPDGLFVEISSNNGGSWTRVVSHTLNNGNIWTANLITQSMLDSAGITRTATMRLRFIASDNSSPNQTVVEAGVDAVKVYRSLPDCNGNGVPDATDIANGTSFDCNSNGVPDECDIASGLLHDCSGGPVGIRSLGGNTFGNFCIGCHGVNGTGATGPNIRNKSRTQIHNRLINQAVLHPGGTFPNLTLANFANLEAFLADGGSRGRADFIPDECEPPGYDCNNNGISDACELEAGTQVDLDYDGIPDNCCRADWNHDYALSVADIFSFLASWFSAAPGADFNHDGSLTIADIFGFIATWFRQC